MLKRLLVLGFGTSLAQVIIFYSFILMVYWFGAAFEIMYPGTTSNAEDDYYVLFTAILFPILLLIQNLLAAIINNAKATYVLMAIALAAYIVGIVSMGEFVSFKTGLCLAFGLLVIGLKTRIDQQLAKWWLT